MHVTGYEVQGIFETFKDQGMICKAVVSKVSGYFKPKKVISYERLVFHTNKEIIDNYIVRLSFQVLFQCFV